MKIKNILSSVLTVALSLTSVASVFAYTAPESVKVDVTHYQYSDAEVADFGIELPEGTGYYNLDFKISELGDVTRTITKSGRADVVSGWGIVKVEMKCVAPDGKTLKLDYDNSTAPSKAGNATSTEYNGIQLLYDGVSVEGFLPQTAGTITELPDGFFNVDVIASLGTTITISPSISYGEFENSLGKGEAQPVVCDPITVTLPGGSTPAPVDPITVTEAANGATVLEYADDYDGDKTLEGKYIVMHDAEIAGAGTLTAASRVVVEYEDAENPSLNKVVEYGKSLFKFLGLTGDGDVNAKEIKFGIVYENAQYKADKFTFTIIK